MKNKIIGNLSRRKHKPEDIHETLLYRNRQIKSLLVVMMMFFMFTTQHILYYLYNGKFITIWTLVQCLNVSIFMIALCCFFLFPYHPWNYGFNTRRFKYNIITGLPVGLILMSGAIFLRTKLVAAGNDQFGFHFSWYSLIKAFTFYPIIVLSQEVAIRGFLQSYFMAVLEGPWKKASAIIISSIVFSVFHIMLGIRVTIILFIYSIFAGWFYEKSRSLVGVSVIHFFAGNGLLMFNRFGL